MELFETLQARWDGLSSRQRLAVYGIGAFNLVALLVFLLVGPEAIFHQTALVALWFSNQPYGAPMLMAIIVVVSFPPLFGYSTAITLCGLGWGVSAPKTDEHKEMNGTLLKGWLLASSSCLLGSAVSFILLRRYLLHFTFSALQDKKFIALSRAIAKRRTKMVILIRFCPFPFSYSNLLFASLKESVSLKQFMLATALITPKLALHVFVGARMFLLMDRESRSKLDGWGKVANVAYVVLGSGVGALTGWIVWKETTKILEQMEREDRDGDEEQLLHEQSFVIDDE